MQHKSFWSLEKMPEFSPLPGDVQAGTVIVGAGISGLLCAYLLQRKGVSDIALIDSGEVCGGVTANTTAKITSQHGLIYAKLASGLGEDSAARYLEANEQAIRQFREIIEREQIDCEFTPCSAWIYTTSEFDLEMIEDEVTAAQNLGMAATFETKSELPLKIEGAVKFPGQAYFHPLKFARQICDIIVGAGCKIYTKTTATAAGDGIVYTDKGDIRAENIVCCSHYPFIDKSSLLFAKIYQSRSYVIALKNAGTLRDIYVDCAEGGLSFRPQKDSDGSEMVLFGAYDHKTGHEAKALHFSGLQEEASQYYPGNQTAYMWSAQDCMTHDGIPYIGRYEKAGDKVYIATGFNKWGMTSAMAAADIISDIITTGSSEYINTFSINRIDIRLQGKSFVKQSVDIVGNFLTHLTMASDSLKDIHNDQGGIIEVEGKRVGVYKDANGQLHAVKPMCTHMGCAVKWNKDENTWDCTCHGSRFDYRGNVLGGPALKPLERLEIEVV